MGGPGVFSDCVLRKHVGKEEGNPWLWLNLRKEQRAALRPLGVQPKTSGRGDEGGDGKEEAARASPQELGGGSEPVTLTLRREADWPRRAAGQPRGSGSGSELSWRGSPQVFLACPALPSRKTWRSSPLKSKTSHLWGSAVTEKDGP